MVRRVSEKKNGVFLKFFLAEGEKLSLQGNVPPAHYLALI